MNAARPFVATLRALRLGELDDELTSELHQLVEKCQATGRAGSITLTLSLKPGKGGQIEVIDDIKVKNPKPERGSSIMFATPEGNLQREDPRQGKLPGIRTVEASTNDIRQVG